MDAFVALAQAELGIKACKEECSWLRTLFQVVLDNIYNNGYTTMSCEEICLHILNIVVSRNGNILPTNHAMLSVNDLFKYANNAEFVGKIGNTVEMAEPEFSQDVTGFATLEERDVILIGFLTTNPRSKTSSIPGMGIVFLEDKKNAVICQVCGLGKQLLNKLVLLPKWNFIPANFPVFIFEGETLFGYIEVVEDCICIGEEKVPCVIPNSLSIGDYVKMESKSEKFNLRGCLRAISPIHSSCHDVKKPFFLAQLVCSQTRYSTVLVLQGEKFTHWYNCLIIGQTYMFSKVRETTMNKGQPSERTILATTNRSDFFKVHEAGSCVQLETEKTELSNEKKRKRDEQENNDNEPEQVKRHKETELSSSSNHPTRYIIKHSSKSEVFWCSAPVTYEGVITAVINIEAGVYEVDNRMNLYTHYQPCSNFGCGLRVGAVVSLCNVHLCKLDQKVLGFSCCTYSTIRVVQHSKLASQFKALVPALSIFHRTCQSLSLVQFVLFLDVIDLLTKKFKPTLSRTDIIGPKIILKSSSSSPRDPTILSHVVDLDSFSSSVPRDIYKDFFGHPHSCVVSRPCRKRAIPKPCTLKDILNVVDNLGSQGTEMDVGKRKEPYGWRYKEIAKDEFPEDTMLIGWLRCCSKTGQLCLCDQTATIPCLIVNTGTSKTIHKCTSNCLDQRKEAEHTIVAKSDTEKIDCPLVHTCHLGAILKVESFKIIVESFYGRELFRDESDTTSDNLITKIYLVFSLTHCVVLGAIPGVQCLRVCTNWARETKTTNTTGVSGNATQRCFVFLMKTKELKALDLKESEPTLISCVHGYFLAEVKRSENGDSNGIRLELFKKLFVTIRFTKDCSFLSFLHPGCLYYVSERCHVGQTSRIQKALDTKGVCPMIEMSSSLRCELADLRLASQAVYQEWRKLSETCLGIFSVRECLSRRTQTAHGSKGSNYQESFLLSFRGIVVNRDHVLSNQSNESCPFPKIPSGKAFVPHYGLVTRAQAHAVSLAFCFLGTRQIVLTVRDIETADAVKVYIDLSTRSYPLGLVPGAVVTFLQVSKHVSRKGNIYCSFKACSDVIVESFPTTSGQTTTLSGQLSGQLNWDATEVRQIIDFVNSLRHGEVIPTVACVVCRITAVQRVAFKWTCAKCGKLANDCYCYVAGGDQTWLFTCQAKCIVEDGTSEAMLYVDDDNLIKDMLLVRGTTWDKVKDLSRTLGEVWYQRSSNWNRNTGLGDSKADSLLFDIISSPHVFRKIKILCKQFKIIFNDNMRSGKGHETRTITVDHNQHSTYIHDKITLNVLDVKEIKAKEQARRLVDIITKINAKR